MVHIGDLVGEADHPPFQSDRPNPVAAAPGVAGDAVFHLKGEIQTLAVLFQLLRHTDALEIVTKMKGADGIERPLAGVAERGMA